MKKYLTLATLLGAIAFLSVSYLAQADEKPTAPAMMHAMPEPEPMHPGAAQSPFKMDHDMCSMLASAPTTEGAAPSAEARDTAFKKCMIGKGHTEEELKKADDEASAADKAAHDHAAAPKADAPAHAPAAK